MLPWSGRIRVNVFPSFVRLSLGLTHWSYDSGPERGAPVWRGPEPVREPCEVKDQRPVSGRSERMLLATAMMQKVTFGFFDRTRAVLFAGMPGQHIV